MQGSGCTLKTFIKVQKKKFFFLSFLFFPFNMTFFSDIAEKVSHLFDTPPDEPKKEDDDYIEQQLLNEKHRYDSFAAVRHGAQVKFFVDGQNYCW